MRRFINAEGHPNMTGTIDQYVLSRTSAEYQRLRQQSRMWEEATARVLGKTGLDAGAKCLDAGCGPGEVMRLMREKAGETGHVTGVDIDGAIGAEAIGVLSSHYGKNVSFYQSDLMAPECIPGAPFDLVFARFVLFHQKQPVEFLRRLWSLTKPGGTLVIMDHDIITAQAWPEYVRAIGGFIFETFGKSGIDPSVGRRLPELFEAAGIGRPDGADASTIFLPGTSAAPMVIAVAASLLPAAERMGTMTPERFEEMVTEFKAAAAKESGWVYWPMLIGAWKQKPSA